jgi:leader peptidase (prepilin peptidase)/N-methyltransferase
LNPSVAFAVVCAFIFGINIGSFLNVVIWRLPRGGSIAEPTWSYCPKCEHRLGALDLVPVLSFLMLGRKCRYCKAPISWRYPAIEMLTALLFVAVAWRFGASVDTIFYCLFVATLVCVFFIDLEHFIIPDGLNLTAAFIGFVHNGVAIALKEPGQFTVIRGLHIPSSIIGFALYAALVYMIGLLSYVVIVSFVDKRKNPFKATWEYVADNVIDWGQIGLYYAGAVIPPLRRYVVEPEPLEGFTAEEIEADEEAGGMGSGDGKLAAAIGANLYIALALQSFLIAIFVGAFIGSIIMIRERRRLGGRTAIPFGPHMAIGALVSLLFGQDLVHAWQWYVSTVGGAVTGGHTSANGTGLQPPAGLESSSGGR